MTDDQTRPPSALPGVAVLSSKMISGVREANDWEAKKPTLLVSFEHLFSQEFSTDAHFLTYRVLRNADGYADAAPRINKGALQSLREQGHDVLTTLIALDYDNPDHQAWTQDSFDAFLCKLNDISDDVVHSYAALYTTRAGARLVYVLAEPLPVDEAEPYIRGLIAHMSSAGLDVDPACCDWTRLFRAPHVKRDGQRTIDAQFSMVDLHLDARLDVVNDVSPVGKPAKAYSSKMTAADKPKAGAAIKLTMPGPALTVAKRMLKGRDAFDVVFNDKPIPPDARDVTIHALVGQCVGMLFKKQDKGTSPEFIYGLLLGAVEQLHPDADTPDWSEVLWRAVTECWGKEQARKDSKAEAASTFIDEQEASAAGIRERITKGVRLWKRDLPQDPDAAWAWISKRFLASAPCGSKFHIMGIDGQYDTNHVGKGAIIPAIKGRGVAEALPLVYADADGRLIKKSANRLVEDHTAVFSEIRQTIGARYTHLDYSAGHGQMPTLVMNRYSIRTDIDATFNADVDTWLHLLFGDEYQAGIDWICGALTLDRICKGIAVIGSPGCGKKLLFQGMAECVTGQSFSSGEELGDYQSMLTKSPFLVLDEGIPAGMTNATLSEKFRTLVGGAMTHINQKYQSAVMVEMALRFMFLANNDSMLRGLSSNKSLSKDDQSAILDRLTIIDASNGKASAWLNREGSFGFTAREGSRWIKGDAGAPSDYVVAKHFLWLLETNEIDTSVRFLGGQTDNTAFGNLLAAESGDTAEVIELLAHMLDSPHLQGIGKGLSVDKHEAAIYVTSSAIHEWAVKRMQTGTRLTTRAISFALESISLTKQQVARATVFGTRERVRWNQLDLDLMLHACREHGHPHSLLQTLTETRDNLIITTPDGV